jgi:hypothetical protein
MLPAPEINSGLFILHVLLAPVTPSVREHHLYDAE